MTVRLLRLKEVSNQTGLSKSSIYRLIDIGEFPQQVSVTTHSVRWIESEIQEWIATKINQNRNSLV